MNTRASGLIEDDLPTALMESMTPLLALCRQIVSAAKRDAAVLLVGEPELDADLIARLIHSCGPTREGRLVTFPSAGLPASLVTSELFGHLAGSFPGAYREKRGLVWQADGGTLFIDDLHDEVGEVVCRFIETGGVQPIGATTPLGRVRVRVIAATSEDRQSPVSSGFRADSLYERFPVQLRIPGRESGRDVVMLLRRLLEEVGTMHNRCSSSEDLRELQAFALQCGASRRPRILSDLEPHLRTA